MASNNNSHDDRAGEDQMREVQELLNTMDPQVASLLMQMRSEMRAEDHMDFLPTEEGHDNSEGDISDEKDDEEDSRIGNAENQELGHTDEGVLHEQAEDELCQGLFDNILDPSPVACLERAKTQYHFDFNQYKKQLDFYGRVRMMNWIRSAIRRQSQSIENIITAIPSLIQTEFQTNNELLIPVIPSDPLLSILDDFDDDLAMDI